MSVGAGAIRAGLAVVELGVDLTPLQAGLSKAASMLKGYAGKVATMGAAIGGMGAALAAPIGALFREAVSDAAGVGSLALQLGTTAERASALRYALSTVGIEEGQLIAFTRHLSTQLASAADGSKDALDSFARLGLSFNDLHKLDVAGQMQAIGSAIARMPESFDRSTQAAHYFGRAGLESLRLFGAGGAGLKERMDEAAKVGAVVTTEQATQAKEIARAWAQMAAAVKYAFLEIGRAILPNSGAIKDNAAAIMGAARAARKWISENKQLFTTLFAVGSVLVAAGGALVALGVAGAAIAGIFAGVGAAIGGALIAIKGAVAVVVSLFSPWGVVILAAAAALGLMGYAAYRSADVIKGELASSWDTLKTTATNAWGAIVQALKRGDVREAARLGMLGLNILWLQAKISFTRVWREMTAPVREALANVRSQVNALVEDLRPGWELIADGFRHAWRSAMTILGDVRNYVRQFVANLKAGWAELGPSLQAALSAIGAPFMAVGALFKKALDAIAPYWSDFTEGLADNWGSVFSRMLTIVQRMTHDSLAYMLRESARVYDALGAKGIAARLKDEAADQTNTSNKLKREQEATEKKRRKERAQQRQFAEDMAEYQAWLDEQEREEMQRELAAANRPGAAGGAPGLLPPGVQAQLDGIRQAAREVRGTFGASLSGSNQSYQQALGVGQQVAQRQLLDKIGETNTILGRIEDKVEGAPAFA